MEFGFVECFNYLDMGSKGKERFKILKIILWRIGRIIVSIEIEILGRGLVWGKDDNFGCIYIEFEILWVYFGGSI